MIKSYSDPCSVWDPLDNKVAIARKEAPDPDNADLRKKLINMRRGEGTVLK